MRSARRTGSVRSSVVSRAHWLCDGCGRWRPVGSTKYVITEGREIVGQLCVFCNIRQNPDAGHECSTEAAQAGGVEDPFSDDPLPWVSVWEEVAGGVRESAACESVPETPAPLRNLATADVEADVNQESPNPHP